MSTLTLSLCRWYTLRNKPDSKKAAKERGEIEAKVTFIVQSTPAASSATLSKTSLSSSALSLSMLKKPKSIKSLAHSMGGWARTFQNLQNIWFEIHILYLKCCVNMYAFLNCSPACGFPMSIKYLLGFKIFIHQIEPRFLGFVRNLPSITSIGSLTSISLLLDFILFIPVRKTIGEKELWNYSTHCFIVHVCWTGDKLKVKGNLLKSSSKTDLSRSRESLASNQSSNISSLTQSSTGGRASPSQEKTPPNKTVNTFTLALPVFFGKMKLIFSFVLVFVISFLFSL